MDSQLIAQFTEYLTTKGRSNSTIIAYKKDLQQLQAYLTQKAINSDFLQANLETLNQFIESISKSGEFTLKTVSRKINSIKTFYHYLYEKAQIKVNPSEGVKHPKLVKQAPRVLSGMEYRALRDIARNNIRLFTIVELLLQTGMRIGELARLNREDVLINGAQTFINIVKFESYPARTIELNESASIAIKDYLAKVVKPQKEDYLFYTKSGRPLLIRNIRSAIDKLFQKSEIKHATVNDIRNTFIIYQLANNLKISVLAEYVGHQKTITTQRYLEFVSKHPGKETTKIVTL
jgi:site-specific recombinase XerD